MPEVTAFLTEEQMQILLDLADKRGVDANTVLQQAVETEKLLSENVGAHDELLIKKDDNTISKIVFDHQGRESADYHFKLAIADRPPPTVIRNSARFREAIRARRAWRINLTLAVAPDTNINSATEKENVDIFGLPFVIDRAARARSGIGFVAGGDASVRLRRDSKVPVYVTAFGRAVRYSDPRFNDIFAGGELGPEFRLSGGRLLLAATALERWYGGRHLTASRGGKLKFDKVIGGKWELEGALAARRNAYSGRSDLDGWDIEASIAPNRALGPATLASAYGAVQRSAANDPGQSNWQGRVGFSLLKEMGWGLRPQIGFELGHEVHDAPLALFGRTRREWRLQATASIYKRDWSFAGFAPSMRLTWSRDLSTISIYDQKRLQAELGITKAF